jgi:hypothetical protein
MLENIRSIVPPKCDLVSVKAKVGTIATPSVLLKMFVTLKKSQYQKLF